MLSTFDSRACSDVKGEMQWANFRAQISIGLTKIYNFTSSHVWTHAKILGSLDAGVVSIGFQSKLRGLGWNSMGKLLCSNFFQSINTKHFTSIHLWKSTKIVSSLGANVVILYYRGANVVHTAFQSKFWGPGWNAMDELTCSKRIKIVFLLAQFVPASDFRANSQIQGEARIFMFKVNWNPSRSRISHEFIYRHLKFLNPLGPNVANIKFQSKFRGPGSNPVGECSCPRSIRNI